MTPHAVEAVAALNDTLWYGGVDAFIHQLNPLLPMPHQREVIHNLLTHLATTILARDAATRRATLTEAMAANCTTCQDSGEEGLLELHDGAFVHQTPKGPFLCNASGVRRLRAQAEQEGRDN